MNIAITVFINNTVVRCAMAKTKFITLPKLIIGAFCSICVLDMVANTANALPLLGSTEINKYLVIGTGEGSSGNEFSSLQMSDVEIGADQEVVSNSDVGAPSQRVGSYNGGLDLTGTWVPNDGDAAVSFVGNRFDDTDPDHPDDTVGISDLLPGARPIYEGIDYSGNVALTGSLATFESSNVDVNADIGIQCNRDPASCFPNASSTNSYFAPDGDSVDPLDITYDPFDDLEQDLNALEGVSQFDPSGLLSDLAEMRDFIVNIEADFTITSGFVNQNIKDSGAAVITDLDAIDAAGNGDGIAIIDIDMDGAAFVVNNTDWILQSTMDTDVIFRMADGTQFDFSNSSILLGDGTGDSTDVINELGAIFFMDAFMGTNELFNLNNVILGGIGLWDFTDFNPDTGELLSTTSLSSFDPVIGDNTVINLQDSQGCAQFIGHQVLMSNNRWNRCSQQDASIPEPGIASLIIFGLMYMMLYIRRRNYLRRW